MKNRGFKAFMALFVVFGMASISFAEKCPIPEDIEDEYDYAIEKLKSKEADVSIIRNYKRLTIGDSFKGDWSVWKMYNKDCSKTEKYYREAHKEVLEKYNAKDIKDIYWGQLNEFQYGVDNLVSKKIKYEKL